MEKQKNQKSEKNEKKLQTADAEKNKQEFEEKTTETKKPEEKIISEKQKVSEIPTENKQKTTETKKPETQNKKIVKKNEAVVNIQNAPVSTKYSMAICKFIKNKQIEKAINELEQVLIYKKAIPMVGGVGHKKSARGFASGSGKYPQDATKYFITLLKSLSANAITNGLEKPIITEAVANIGQKPRARFGKWKRKRTHIRLVAREKKENKIKKEVKN